MTKTNKRIAVKVKLKKILCNSINYTKLFNAIQDVNDIVTYGYFFMRSYILYIIENNESETVKIEEPCINIDFIRTAFKVFDYKKIDSNGDESKSKGKPLNGTNKLLFDRIKKYYKKIYCKHINKNKISFSNLSYILGQSYQQIYIAIINNIKYHYDKYIWKFIKLSFANKYIILKEEDNQEKIDNFTNELTKIKSDLLEGTTKSNNESKLWIQTIKDNIIPNTYNMESFERDVVTNTFKYLKCMQYMNKLTIEKEVSSYQIFPIRTSVYGKYIKINTSALIDIMCNEGKLELFKKSGDNNIQEQLWNKYFNLKDTYKREGYSFNYEIETDGYAVSLNFINNDEIKNKNNKKENFKKARINANQLKKSLSENEYVEHLNRKKETNLKKIEADKKKSKEIQQKKKNDFKLLPIEEQDKIKNKLNDTSEFPYIDKLLKNEEFMIKFKEEFEKGNVLLCDPGKRSIFYMMASGGYIHIPIKDIKMNNFGISKWSEGKNGEKHKILNYTSITRRRFIKSKHYGVLIQKYMSKLETVRYKEKCPLKVLLQNEIIKCNKQKKRLMKLYENILLNDTCKKTILAETMLINKNINILKKYLKSTKNCRNLKEIMDNDIKNYKKEKRIILKMMKDIPYTDIYKKLLNEIEIIDDNVSKLYGKIDAISIKSKLKELNSKECNHGEFVKYVKNKLIINKKMRENSKYVDNDKNFNYIKKLKWYSYLNKRKHEMQLINTIRNEFGENVIIIMGDWSAKGAIKYMPTPNISIKRKLKEYFRVYHIDEFNTSKIHYKTNVKCTNQKVNIVVRDKDNNKKDLIKRLHAVLSYKIEKSGRASKYIESGCINRDKNSVLNMERIIKSLLEIKRVPEEFSRKKNTGSPKIKEKESRSFRQKSAVKRKVQ